MCVCGKTFDLVVAEVVLCKNNCSILFYICYYVTWSDTPSLAVESSDSASGPSPRVQSAHQRKVSHGCSEGNTPKTPKSAVVASAGKVSDDRVFFGSNFSVERLGDLATMSRPTLGELSRNPSSEMLSLQHFVCPASNSILLTFSKSHL